MELNETTNIKLWEKKINFETINKTRLNYFDLSDKKDYLNLIKSNYNNPEKMQDIYKSYKENQRKALNTLEAIEKENNRPVHLLSRVNHVKAIEKNNLLSLHEVVKPTNRVKNKIKIILG